MQLKVVLWYLLLQLLKQMEELHTARSIQSNVLATIETITLCMPGSLEEAHTCFVQQV